MASQQSTFLLSGGLNLAGLTLALKRGEAVLLDNFECRSTGGYRRFDGFERYDGHPQPSLATYKRLPFTVGTSTIFVGANVSGPSGSCHVLDVIITAGSFDTDDASGELIVDRVTGTFGINDALEIGVVVCAAVADAIEDGTDQDDDYDANTALAADSARALIQAVPGEGGVLGVAIFNGMAHAFRNAVGGASACMYVEGPTGWVLKKNGLAPNGRYRTKVENFNGAVIKRALYGVSGVHKAFEWTGATWTDITTGTTDDTPTFIESHNNTLWLAFRGGSLQASAPGLPLNWTSGDGALEFATGDEITGLKSIVGSVLAVYGETTTRGLYGSSSDDYEIKILSPDSGAFADSIQNVPGQTFSVDQRGLMPLASVQAYGDFSAASVSQKVQPAMDLREGTLMDTVAVRGKSIYRLLYADGTAISVTLKGPSIVGYGILSLPISPTVATQGKRVDDTEMILVGSADGFVYRTDVGMSFDGQPIDALVITAPDAVNGLRQIKQFQNFMLQIASSRSLNLLIQPIFDYELSPSDVARTVPVDGTFADGSWDIGNWDEASFDGGDSRPQIAMPSVRIDGVAEVVQMAIFHGGEIRPPFVLEAGTFIYKNRGFRK